MNCAADLLGFISSDALLVGIGFVVTLTTWWLWRRGYRAKTPPTPVQNADRDIFGEQNEYPYAGSPDAVVAERLRRRVEAAALQFHHLTDGAGDVTCEGVRCPGVQQLTAFWLQVVKDELARR